MLERTLAIKEQHFGKGHVQCADTLANLASVYSELGDAHRARDVFQEALAIEERHFGQGHMETAITLNKLALAYGETGDLQSMKMYLERSLEIKDANFGVGHQEISLTLANLGMACAALGQLALARAFTDRALMACKQGDPPQSRRHIMVVMYAANVHRALGEGSKADEFASSALRSLVHSLGATAVAKALMLEKSRSSRIWASAGRQDVLGWLDMALSSDQLHQFSSMIDKKDMKNEI